jgi:multiple sugar transport system permease protein
MKRNRGKIFSDGFSYAIILLFVISALLPFFWMVVTSFKTKSELFSSQFPLWVQNFTWQNYVDLFRSTKFTSWFLNTVVVAGSTTLISSIFGFLAAYGITRIPSKFSITIVQTTLLTYLIPRTVFVIPLYILLDQIGLLNSLLGLTIAYMSFTLPFTMWLMISFFQVIPKDLDEAALIDGCSRLGALVRVVLPLAAPGIVATSIYSFSAAWDDFMYPLALMQGQSKLVITVGIASLRQADIFAWGQIMAAGTLGAIPILFLYMFVYKRIVSGLVSGSVKG